MIDVYTLGLSSDICEMMLGIPQYTFSSILDDVIPKKKMITKMEIMNTVQNNSDEKFMACLTEARKRDNLRLEEDIGPCEEYVFSKKFENNMRKLLVVRNRRKNWKKMSRYAASVAAVVLIVVGIYW